MNIQSLLGKFKQGSTRPSQLTVVVQPSALFFSSLPDVSLPPQSDFQGGAWQEVLLSTLSEHGVSDIAVDVVLHSGLYQTYQIDKPAIPEDELASALPFLVKDLITERVSDIIADASLLPSGNKLQVFVVTKSIVTGLNELLTKRNLQLNKVLVEDEVWAHSAGELSQFLLLQRSKQGQFKVSAYVDGQSAFQRTIRGVVAPLTGVASSALQLDGLALELQRSIDYLSSQLRGTSIHQMKVCCDEEQQTEVAHALSERLSVGVTPLSEHDLDSGTVLLRSASLVAEGGVNLFPESLKPRKEYFSLKNVVLVWSLSALTLLACFAWFNVQQASLSEELSLLRSQETEFRKQMETLTQRLAKHKPSPAKVAAVNRLEQDIDAKRRSLDAVSEYDDSQQIGYSGVMRSLAKLGRSDISLHSIFIDANRLDLKGLAREPQVIPNWVSQFKSELDLVGRAFDKLQIGRNEQDVITFELKTKESVK